MRKLSEKLKETLDYIKDYIKSNGFPPTLRDIGKHFGIYTKAALDRLRRLEMKGYIKRQEGIARSISIVKMPKKTAQ